MNKKLINQLMKKSIKKPLVLGYVDDRGGCPVFAGSFTLEQLCFLKEVLNRKIDSMLDQGIVMDAQIKPVKNKEDLAVLNKESMPLPINQ